MKVCFDTSVLVAALLLQHPHHAAAFARLQEVKSGAVEGYLSTHCLAELYATLTALPLKPRLLPVDAQRMIQKSVLSSFSLITLDADDYRDALEIVVLLNLSSGAIYDALHIVGARRAVCTALYTLNLRHFQSLAPGDPLICKP